MTMPIVAEIINLDGHAKIRVKENGYLVGKGYFDTIADVAAALGTPDRLARLVIKEK